MMITKLTPEQEEQLPVYREKWKTIGINTNIANRNRANDYITEMYKVNDLTPPQYRIWMDSPIACLLAYALLMEWEKGNPPKKVKKKTHDPLNEQITEALWMDVIGKLEAQLPTGNWKKYYWALDFSDLKQRLNSEMQHFCYGMHDYCWFSFYDYSLNVLNLDFCKVLEPNIELAKDCSWFLPYEKVIILADKPEILQINDNDDLHNAEGPAVKYRDGISIYALNGVRVSQYIAETPASELPCDLIVKERNAEIRNEIVKKIGMERIIDDLECEVKEKINGYELYKKNSDKIGNYRQQGDVLLKPENKKEEVDIKPYSFKDLSPSFVNRLKSLEYQLVNLKIDTDRYRPYLIMTNASTPEKKHIEGVNNENVNTVLDAIFFRNQTQFLPFEIT